VSSTHTYKNKPTSIAVAIVTCSRVHKYTQG
jgi:hypothetical protein